VSGDYSVYQNGVQPVCGVTFRTDYFNAGCNIGELSPFQMKRFVPTYVIRSQLIIDDFFRSEKLIRTFGTICLDHLAKVWDFFR